MNEWWQSKSPKEQQVILFGGIFTVVILFIFMVIKPMNERHAVLEKQLATKSKDLVWLRQNVSHILSHQSSKSGQPSRKNLQFSVSRAAQQYRVPISNMIPKQDRLSVVLEAARFDQVMKMLGTLEKRYQIKVFELDMSDVDNDGTVKVRRMEIGF